MSDAPGVIAIHNASPSQRRLIDHVAARFHANGLDLPEVDVWFTPDPRDCQGHAGLFSTAVRPWRITICSDLRFVPSHELAHAWIEANLDAEARQDFVEAQGLASWNDRAHPWNRRGVEIAAVTIQQNLRAMPEPPKGPVWADRIAAYELLTGRTSPLRFGS